MAQRGYTTYHCLCSSLLLATLPDLENVSKRHVDDSFICNLGDSQPGKLQPSHCVLVGTSIEEKALLVELEDGFEKRFAVGCARCGLMAGYQLDRSQFEGMKAELGRRDDVVYLLVGSLVRTSEMEVEVSTKAQGVEKSTAVA